MQGYSSGRVFKWIWHIIPICFLAVLTNGCGFDKAVHQDDSLPQNIDSVVKEKILEVDEKESEADNPENEYPEIQNYSYRTGTIEKDFYEYIADNPIDKNIVQEDMSNTERIERAVEYQEAWQREIDHSFGVLKEYLTEEDYEKLYAGYQSWETYISNTQEIEIEIFYPSGKYQAGEGLTYPMPMEVKAARIRDYAILLKSLVYEFTGTVEFQFNDRGELVSQNEHSCLFYNDETYTYSFEVYLKSGELLADESIPATSVVLEELSDSIVQVRAGAGTNAANYWFYDIESGQISDTFSNISAIKEQKIVYMGFVGEDIRLIVRDIFDEEIYYKDFDRDFSNLAILESVLLEAKFLDNDRIQIKYLSGTEQEEVTEIIEL